MHIKIDDVQSPAVIELIEEHLEHMAALSPPESCHPLGVSSLRQDSVTLWSCWSGDELLGIGALQELDKQHGEIKSMRTAKPHLRQGVAESILTHLLSVADDRSYHRISLETGSADSFQPARTLYAKYGFVECEPFGTYTLDPHSTFMTLLLEASKPEPQ